MALKKRPAQTYTEMVESGKAHKTIKGSRAYRRQPDEVRDQNITSLVQFSLEKLEELARQTESVNLLDTETVKLRAQIYTRSCMDCSVLPTMMGFATSMGYTYEAVQKFYAHHPHHPTTSFLRVLKDEYANMLFSAGLYNFVNPVSSIFGTKAMYNWRDVVTIATPSTTDPLEGQKTPEEIAQRYQYLTHLNDTSGKSS